MPIAAVITLERAFILQTVLFVSIFFFFLEEKTPHKTTMENREV